MLANPLTFKVTKSHIYFVGATTRIKRGARYRTVHTMLANNGLGYFANFRQNKPIEDGYMVFHIQSGFVITGPLSGVDRAQEAVKRVGLLCDWQIEITGVIKKDMRYIWHKADAITSQLNNGLYEIHYFREIGGDRWWPEITYYGGEDLAQARSFAERLAEYYRNLQQDAIAYKTAHNIANWSPERPGKVVVQHHFSRQQLFQVLL